MSHKICTFLWFAACLFYSIDTGRFVYVSLSQTLCGGLFLLLIHSVAVAHGLVTRGSWSMGRIQMLVLLWCGYMLSHAWISGMAEGYKLNYLLVTLPLVFSLPYMLRNALLGRRTLEDGVLLMASVQIGFLLAQAVGIGPDYNSFFRLTGCTENPNVTAMLLSIGVPLMIGRVREGRHRGFYILLLALAAVFLVALRCRTAFVGLAVMAMVHLSCSGKVRAWWRSLSLVKRILLCAGALVLALSLADVLYLSKRDSSDGRLLVWRISAMMVKEQHWGVGIGMFEHDYNLRQGEYFASGVGSGGERMVADTVFMSYNDFLEHGVEAGLVGMLFIVAFYGALVVRACRVRNVRALAIIAAVMAMSCVNFFYSTIQPWLAFLACVACLLADGKADGKVRFRRISRIFAVVACSIGLYAQMSLLTAQMRLKGWNDRAVSGERIALADAERLAERIGTSEAYWTFMYRQYFKRKEYEKALAAIREAARYTSVPNVHFSEFSCLDRLGRTDEGIVCLQKVRNALPLNLTSRMMLLQCHERKGMKREALEMANEIVRMPVKIESKTASNIKEYATEYINHKNRTHNEED